MLFDFVHLQKSICGLSLSAFCDLFDVKLRNENNHFMADEVIGASGECIAMSLTLFPFHLRSTIPFIVDFDFLISCNFGHNHEK